MTSEVLVTDSYLARAEAERLHLDLAREGGRSRLALERQLDDARLGLAEIYRELYEAAQMQRRHSGPHSLRRGGFDIAAELFPVRHVSGDFFNISDLGDTHLLAIGDIAGKGLAAAMWFTHLLGLTRQHAESCNDPAEAMAAINLHLCAQASGPPLTTMFLARLNWHTGEFVYCNAGHPAPLLVRSDGAVDFLDHGGPVLGAVHNAAYANKSIATEPGDFWVGFSDGLTECRNHRSEEFGVQRIFDAVKVNPRESASRVLFSLVGAVQDFAGTQLREDDFALMVVRNNRHLNKGTQYACLAN
jgi:serine phosphatase RsbU (regulator of sigma subunit)